MPVNQSNAAFVAAQLSETTEYLSPNTTTPDDINLVVDIVDNIVQTNLTKSEAAKIFGSLVNVTSQLMNSNRDAIRKSELASNSSRRFIHNVELIAETVPISSNSTSPVIETENIVVYATEINHRYFDGLTFLKHQNDYRKAEALPPDTPVLSAIELPSNLLSENFQNKSTVRISLIFYNSNSMFRDETLERTTMSLPSNEIIAASVKNNNIKGLSSPVQFLFHRFTTPDENYFPHCYFWDTTKNDEYGGWNSKGCELAEVTDTTITCHCNHLTSFSALMTPCGSGSSCPCRNVDDYGLAVISYVGSAISLASITAAIVCLSLAKCCKRGERLSETFKIHINLCVSLILSIIAFLSIRDSSLCYATALGLHYFLLSSVMWMMVEGIAVLRDIVLVFQSKWLLCGKRKFYLIAVLGGWGFPLVVTATLITAQSLLDDSEFYGLVEIRRNDWNPTKVDLSYCWITNNFVLLGSFAIPALFVIVFNIILVVKVMIVLKKQAEYRTRLTNAGGVNRLRALFAFSSLLGLTWLFGAATLFDYDKVLFSHSTTQCSVLKVFHYLFAICNSMQGFSILLFYVILSKQTRRQIVLRIVSSRTAARNTNRHLYNKQAGRRSRFGQNEQTCRSPLSTLETELTKTPGVSEETYAINNNKLYNEWVTEDKDILAGVNLEMYSNDSA